VVVGDISLPSIQALMHELRYTDRLVREAVVVLSPHLPSTDLFEVLYKYPEKLFYFCGSPMIKDDLRRVRLSHAAACFIFARADSEEVR